MKKIPVSELRSLPKVKRFAYKSPVILTENGAETMVLMTIEDYEELKGEKEN